MKKNYKKGDALFVRYTKTNHTDIFETVGILLKISSVKIELGHNFKETNPIDLTTIPTKKNKLYQANSAKRNKIS